MRTDKRLPISADLTPSQRAIAEAYRKDLDDMQAGVYLAPNFPSPPRGLGPAHEPGLKLSAREVREIRASAGTHRELAKQYSVSVGTVGRVCRGESYRWVADIPKEDKARRFEGQ